MKQLFLLAALLPCIALATNTPDPPKPTTQPIDIHTSSSSAAGAKSHSSSRSSSKSASVSGSKSNATGGKSNSQSSAVTGPSTSAVGDVSPTQTIGDVSPEQSQSFSSDDDTLVEGQRVPAQFLPMILESGCRTGINAGGASRGGSGAAGVSWMTDRCWAMTSVLNFLAMGEYETACDLLVDVNRDQFKRIGHKPDCHAVASRLILADKWKAENQRVQYLGEPAKPDFDPSDYVKKADLAERDKRMAKTLGK